MNYLSQYIVPLRIGVDNTSEFLFEIDNKFFDSMVQTDIKGGVLKAKLLLTQKENAFLLDFSIKGVVDVICDRCLDLCKQPVDTGYEFVAEIGDLTSFDTNSENISVAKSDNELNVADLIFEVIFTSLPVKRVHTTAMGKDQVCNQEMIKILKQYLLDENNHVDPRWEALQELKTKNI